jgi:hypothetical protein
MLPTQASRTRRWVEEAAGDEGHASPVTASYVRVAVGAGSLQRLRAEESRYREINEGHRKHFAAIDVPLGSVGVAAPARPGVVNALEPYESAVQLPIARALASADAASLIAVAEAAAP